MSQKEEPKLTKKPIYSGDEEIGYILIDDEGFMVEEHHYADDY